MNTLQDFSLAYGSLGDALLKHVGLTYTQENQPQITVVLACMSVLADYEWVHLEIRFSGVQEFSIVSKKHYSLELVEGFAAKRIEDVFVFDFSPTISSHTTNAPKTMDEHRQSWFYVTCASFDCQEIEWPES